MTEDVEFSIDKANFMEILRRAASQERTIIEFQTTETDGVRELDTAMDITDHVSALEDQ